MARIYVSGLINTETTVRVNGFPITYYPIDYPFFGVQTTVSGVAYNLARALSTLGDQVVLASMIGQDLQGDLIGSQLVKDGVDSSRVVRNLPQTPSSVVLYAPDGKRQVYCDLKDIQDRQYPGSGDDIENCDIVVACNINFNRKLLDEARSMGKVIATDVHVLSSLDDGYNQEFLEKANIVFLSDEGLPCPPEDFLDQLHWRYPAEIIVLGRGAQGAMLYDRTSDMLYSLPCVPARQVVNTVGAGDALFSAFVHFYAKGMTPLKALQHAQIFASAKIGVSGGAQGFQREEEVLARGRELRF